MSAIHMVSSRRATHAGSDWRWAAIVERNASADGKFVYGVSTTGVYCKASCPSRLPNRENVRLFATGTEAENAGFRSCRRCLPNGPTLQQRRSEIVAELCRFIDGEEQPPSLNALAEHVGLSTYHLHRVFKAGTGLTPRAYASARRAERLRLELQSSSTVTGAIYGAGYNSDSRFYEQSDGVLGMTPTRFKHAGASSNVRFAVGQCSLGAILVAESDRGICAISIGDDPDLLTRELQDRFHNALLIGDNSDFAARVSQVVGMVEAPQIGIDLPLDIRGTAFQQRVWQALRTIPAGERASYAEVAQKIGAPSAVRAVAAACAANVLAVAIPCHRVVRRNGAVSGYRWGVERKIELLQREAKG